MILDKIIGPFQSAFVGGRHISYNYIITHEIFHSFKKKEKRKFLGLKLDMVKTYDLMEWGFILNTLHAFGIHHKFQKLIKKFLTN